MKNGAYVPVIARYYVSIKPDYSVDRLYKFHWLSVNEPLEDSVFDPAQVDSDDFLYRADADVGFEFADSQ